MWTDSHCHLDNLDPSAWQNALHAGVSALVIPGVSGLTEEAVRLAGTDQRIRLAAGWHPLFPPKDPETVAQELTAILDRHQAVRIIGEIGLDYWYPETDHGLQRALFRAQLTVAANRKFPVIIHLRKAWNDFAAMVKEVADVHFILHMYGGSSEQARQLLEQLPHVWFSFGGPAIRESATRAQKAIRSIPPGRILLETDAPDLPPPGTVPPNTPANLPVIGKAIAGILGLEAAELARITSDNARETFQWTAGNA